MPGGVGLKVGGDWYDAVPLRDGRVMLVIGDVVGHGVRAAASMGKLRNVLQYSALDGLAPAAVLQRLNAYFCALPDATWRRCSSPSTTRPRQRIRYSSAGHPPAMLRLPDGTVELLEGGRSMPLCASDQAQYHEAERDLPAGSMLVLYTDGLIERRGESLDVGLERLAESLRERPGPASRTSPTRCCATSSPTTSRRTTSRCSASDVRGRGAPRLSRLPGRAPPALRHAPRASSEWLERVGASDEEAREITVAVNEVAANAVEHAYGLVDAEFVVEADRQVGTASWSSRSGTSGGGGTRRDRGGPGARAWTSPAR